MNRIAYSLSVLGLLVAVAPSAAQSDPRVEWLRQHALAVRSIDPADQTFDDLATLRDVLARTRIVLLGEASHGDGATFLAKTRLIEFLHREMGFDALVFESGFFDCSALAGGPAPAGAAPLAVFEGCVWPMWRARRELDALRAYLESAHASGRRLEIFGLDPDFVAASSRERLAPELRVLLGRSPMAASLATPEFLRVVDNLYAYLDPASSRPSLAAVQRFAAAAESLARTIETDSALSRAERGYWARVLQSLASHALSRIRPLRSTPTRESVEQRDRQMAQNLLWLVDERLAGRRVIVWSATLHAVHNLSAVSVLVDQPTPWGSSLQEMYRTKHVMGDYLRQVRGDAVYTIAFTASEGTNADGPSGRPIPRPDDRALENLFERAGFRYGFVDLRSPAAGGNWLAAEQVAHPLGYLAMRANWSAVVDGVFFIRAMTPSTRREPR